MITANLTAAAVIDGFKLKGGNAEHWRWKNYLSIKIYFARRYGGMFNNPPPQITNTTFLQYYG
jgi:hypothetical protein